MRANGINALRALRSLAFYVESNSSLYVHSPLRK